MGKLEPGKTHEAAPAHRQTESLWDSGEAITHRSPRGQDGYDKPDFSDAFKRYLLALPHSSHGPTLYHVTGTNLQTSCPSEKTFLHDQSVF
jgi:hypothetical protein